MVGRDNYGVFPLKGKPLNVREANLTKIQTNDEIQNIIKILGLKRELVLSFSSLTSFTESTTHTHTHTIQVR